MIEQSIVKNVTLAVTFTECVLKPMHVVIDKIIAIIGDFQFQALVRLAINLMHDKLCAFIKLPVVVAEYADLAYIGYYEYIELTERVKNRNVASAGNPISKVTKNRTAIANNLLRFFVLAISAEMTAVDVVNDVQDVDVVNDVQDIHTFKDIDGTIFRVPRGEPAVPGDAHGVEIAAKYLPRRTEKVIRYLKTKRYVTIPTFRPFSVRPNNYAD